MGGVEQDHVLHVLVDVPWVRLDEVKANLSEISVSPNGLKNFCLFV